MSTMRYFSVGNTTTQISESIFGRCAMAKSDLLGDVNAGIAISSAVDTIIAVTERVAVTMDSELSLAESTDHTASKMLTEGFQQVVEKIKEVFKKLYESIKAFVSRVWGKMRMAFANQEKFVKDNKTKIIEGANYIDKDNEADEIEDFVTIDIVAFTTALDTIAKKTKVQTVDSSGTITVESIDKVVNVVVDGDKFVEAFQSNVADTVVNSVTIDGISVDAGIGALSAVNFTVATNIAAGDTGTVTLGAKTKASVTNNSASPISTGNYSIKIAATCLSATDIGKSISEIREDIIDEFEKLVDNTDTVKVSAVVNDAITFFESAARKIREQSEKDYNKMIKSMEKNLNKMNKKPTPEDGKLLTALYKIYSLLQFIRSKVLNVISIETTQYWKVIKRAYGNYAYVVKQRKIGESTEVNTSNDMLHKYGF